MARKRWESAIKRARRDLDRNAALINDTSRGTTSSKQSTWKRKRGKEEQ